MIKAVFKPYSWDNSIVFEFTLGEKYLTGKDSKGKEKRWTRRQLDYRKSRSVCNSPAYLSVYSVMKGWEEGEENEYEWTYKGLRRVGIGSEGKEELAR